MTQSNANDSGIAKETPLPRRDLLILPLLCIVTALALALGTETIARHFFFGGRGDSCRVHDANIGFTTRPGCIAYLKNAEGSWVTNQYNNCGYRSKEPCGPKPAGTTRIALIGSSFGEGWFVAYDEMFSTRAAVELARKLARPVEVQNLSREHCFPLCAFRRTQEALALNPDILLFAVSPSDIANLDPSEISDRHLAIPASRTAPEIEKRIGAIERIKMLGSQSSTTIAVEHYLFQDPATYLRFFLRHGDPADYLRQPFSATWENRLKAFEVLVAEMSTEAHAAKVPFVLLEIPNFAQAALASSDNIPAGIDPYAFNVRLSEISSRNGIQFISGLDGFKGVPNASKFYYVVDGHINGAGHALISRILVEQLSKGDDAGMMLRDEAHLQAAAERKR